MLETCLVILQFRKMSGNATVRPRTAVKYGRHARDGT